MVELPREKERMLLGVSRMRGVSGSKMMPRLLPILVDYFSQLSTTTSNLQALEQVMEGVQSCVIQSMNAMLLQPYTVEEVKVALKKMAPFKSPGLDGMSQSFVKIIACGWE